MAVTIKSNVLWVPSLVNVQTFAFVSEEINAPS